MIICIDSLISLERARFGAQNLFFISKCRQIRVIVVANAVSLVPFVIPTVANEVPALKHC